MFSQLEDSDPGRIRRSIFVATALSGLVWQAAPFLDEAAPTDGRESAGTLADTLVQVGLTHTVIALVLFATLLYLGVRYALTVMAKVHARNLDIAALKKMLDEARAYGTHVQQARTAADALSDRIAGLSPKLAAFTRAAEGLHAERDEYRRCFDEIEGQMHLDDIRKLRADVLKQAEEFSKLLARARELSGRSGEALHIDTEQFEARREHYQTDVLEVEHALHTVIEAVRDENRSFLIATRGAASWLTDRENSLCTLESRVAEVTERIGALEGTLRTWDQSPGPRFNMATREAAESLTRSATWLRVDTHQVEAIAFLICLAGLFFSWQVAF